jgi:hypothetical protein
MAELTGCAPGFEVKIIDGRPRCVPKKKLYGREGGGYIPKEGEGCKAPFVLNPFTNTCNVPLPGCKTGYAHDSEREACAPLDEVVAESCPTGTEWDTELVACIPRGKRIPSLLERVPKPTATTVLWNTNPREPIYHSPDSTISKGTVGDWRRVEDPDLVKALDLCVDGGDHVFVVTDGRNIEWIGQSRYRLRNLYEVAQEIYGDYIIDPKTKRPLPEAVGFPIKFSVRTAVGYEDKGPLIVEHPDIRVWYLVNPYLKGEPY